MNHFARLPEEAQRMFTELESMVLYLHLDWHVWDQLFGNKEAVETLNRCCRVLGNVIHVRVVDSIILNIAKLTGPIKTGKFENLALEALLVELSGKLPPELEGLLPMASRELEAIRAETEPMTFHRNKRIGHADRTLALNPEAAEAALPRMTGADIARALKRLADFMNAIRSALMDGNIYCYEGIGTTVRMHGSDAAILYMRKGLKLEDLGMKALREQISADDLVAEVRKAVC
jgi:hypothetical protein